MKNMVAHFREKSIFLCVFQTPEKNRSNSGESCEGIGSRGPPGIPFFTEDDKTLLFIPEPDQVARVLPWAKPMARAYLTVVAYTTARISEIKRLTWEDVVGY